jgi:N-acetylglucosamine-6-phosphate deacetylase
VPAVGSKFSEQEFPPPKHAVEHSGRDLMQLLRNADLAAMANTLRELLECGQPLQRVLPVFTSNPARLLMLCHKGHLRAGADADLVVLGGDGMVEDVMATFEGRE